MPKRSDIEAQIAALQRDLESADDDDDFEIEIFKDGKGARIPFRQGKSWLERELGLDFGSPAAAAGDDGQDQGGQGGNGAGQGAASGQPGTAGQPASRSYFRGSRAT